MLAVVAAGVSATIARFFMSRVDVEGLGFDGNIPWVGVGLVAVLVVLRPTVLSQGVRL